MDGDGANPDGHRATAQLTVRGGTFDISRRILQLERQAAALLIQLEELQRRKGRTPAGSVEHAVLDGQMHTLRRQVMAALADSQAAQQQRTRLLREAGLLAGQDGTAEVVVH